jgi:ligand-binding sensor domain-containing protein
LLLSRHLLRHLSRQLFRRLSALACAAALAYPPACAAAPAAPERPSLADYQHTAWPTTDGAPPRILDMAQTANGWLWLATADGLYRFDGVRFGRFALPPRAGMNRDRINSVYGAPNGDLFIAYFAEGISVLHPDGRVEDLPTQQPIRNSIDRMAMDADGSLWVYAGALQHYHDGRWELVADGPDWSSNEGASLLIDGSGQLWVANDAGVYRFDRGARRLIRIGDGNGELLLAPDGRVWLAGGARGLRLLAATGIGRPAAYAHGGHWSGLFDDTGALWRLGCPQPVCLMAAPALDQDGHARLAAPAPDARATAPLQVSGSDAHQILEDRDGDLWVATENGLDRYRRKRFLRSGLPGTGSRYSLAADGAGQVWASDQASGTLWRLRPGAPPEQAAGREAVVVAKGRGGALLVGARRFIERRTAAGIETFALPPGPDGRPRDHHVLGVLDDGRVLWTATMEDGLLGWRDGRWQPPGADW